MNKNITKFFAFFGINLVLDADKNSKWKTFINLLYNLSLIWAIIIIILQFVYHNKMCIEIDALGIIADKSQTLLPTLCHVIILLEAYFRKKTHEELNKTINRIQEKLPFIAITTDNSLQKSILKYFICLNGVCFASEMMILYFVKPGPFCLSIQVKTLALIVMRLNDFQFIFYVLQLMNALTTINQNLGSIRRNHISDKHLNIIQKMSSHIWKASDLMNHRFGWSILSTVSTNFLLLVMSGYWTMFNVYNGRYTTFEFSIVSISFTISPTVNLMWLCFICSKCVENVGLILYHNM